FECTKRCGTIANACAPIRGLICNCVLASISVRSSCAISTLDPSRPNIARLGTQPVWLRVLQTLATPGSTVINGKMRALVEGYFQLKGLGPTKIKGVSDPVELFEVTGLGPLRTRLQRAAGRGLSKFVGREREIEALRHAAALARDGRGQIVAAMADPGVGKSR